MPKSPSKKLADKLRDKKVKVPGRDPLWKGPIEDGVTQSLLSNYLACPERFYLKVMEGLAVNEGFSQRMEYGNLWHACEEGLAAGKDWRKSLHEYGKQLAARFPLQADQVAHWTNICAVQFPIYVEYWKEHQDVVKRTPVFEEEVFSLPLGLPSGRDVRVKGKWDSVDIVDGKSLWIQENKAKGDIDAPQLQKMLRFDIQTQLYTVALEELKRIEKIESWVKLPIVGVRYNVIRRPLAGGKHSIRQHKPSKSNPAGESLDEFYARLGGLIKNEATEDDGTNFFFMRWTVEFLPGEIQKFKEWCLWPILENLLDDYEWWHWSWYEGQSRFNYLLRQKKFPHHIRRHFLLPYGIYNPVSEGKIGELDEFIFNGSELGLTRIETLFPELSKNA